jgi:hypothetical protein
LFERVGGVQDIAMARILRRFALFLSIFTFALSEPGVAANPVGDFFKRIGRSISNLGKSPTPTPTPRRPSEGARRGKTVADEKVKQNPPAATPFVTPTPTSMEIRPATTAPPDRRRSRDLPYGVAVPNRPGLVTSPYAPDQGLVDVRAFPKSTEVIDPFTGKVFLTP